MKTQIIQLEPHDDALSTRDKLNWGQTGHILLVWPKNGRILTRRLDLVLLLRRSVTLGAQLALVTRDPEVQFHARQLGIPVFKDPRQAQNTRWRRPRRPRFIHLQGEPDPRQHGDWQILRETWPRHPMAAARPMPIIARIGLFTIALTALLALAAVLLPGAQISLTPQAQTQAIDIPISASTAFTTANLSGQVPARPITVIVEGRESITTTGTVTIPESSATGNVQFTNLTTTTVSIPEGTLVSAISPVAAGDNPPLPAVRFRVMRAGQAAARQAVTLPVTALVPGSSGNLPPHRITAIEGLLGLSLIVTNPAPTQNGADHLVPGSSDLDRLNLYNRLITSLRQTSIAELKDSLASGDLLLTKTPTLTQVLERTYDPAGAQPATSLRLTLRLEFQALTVSGADLHKLAVTILDGSLPAGFSVVAGSLMLNAQAPPVLEFQPQPAFLWTMHARRTLRAQVLPVQAVGLSLGLDPALARQQLAKGLRLDALPTIELQPSWWPRMPILPFRITIHQN